MVRRKTSSSSFLINMHATCRIHIGRSEAGFDLPALTYMYQPHAALSHFFVPTPYLLPGPSRRSATSSLQKLKQDMIPPPISLLVQLHECTGYDISLTLNAFRAERWNYLLHNKRKVPLSPPSFLRGKKP